MSTLIKFIRKTNLNDFTLIIPSVSVGNVPQLTVDLLVTTLNMQRVGIIWHPGIVSSVGANPFRETCDVSTACELYINEELKLALIQLRSSIEARYANSFFNSLAQNAKESHIKMIVVLASEFAHEMHNVSSSCFRFISNTVTAAALAEHDIIHCNSDNFHSGIGFALKLYEVLLENNISSFLLSKYVSEGDNIPDAVQMLNKLQKIVKNLDSQEKLLVKYPISWDYVFGNPPPVGIY